MQLALTPQHCRLYSNATMLEFTLTHTHTHTTLGGVPLQKQPEITSAWILSYIYTNIKLVSSVPY